MFRIITITRVYFPFTLTYYATAINTNSFFLLLKATKLKTKNRKKKSYKTFPKNWDSKAPSIGTLLAYVVIDYDLNYIF